MNWDINQHLESCFQNSKNQENSEKLCQIITALRHYNFDWDKNYCRHQTLLIFLVLLNQAAGDKSCQSAFSLWENELSDFGEQLRRQLKEKRRKTKRKASSCQKEGPREIFHLEISDSPAVPVTSDVFQNFGDFSLEVSSNSILWEN